jgi:hypothetical protein
MIKATTSVALGKNDDYSVEVKVSLSLNGITASSVERVPRECGLIHVGLSGAITILNRPWFNAVEQDLIKEALHHIVGDIQPALRFDTPVHFF